jgi:hypothetical protein
MKNRTIAAWLGLAVAVIAGVDWTRVVRAEIPAAQSSEPKKADEGAKAEEAKLDQLIMASGTVINGTIVEETKDEVKILVQLGAIKATKATSYRKTDIIEIKRGVKPDEASKAAPTTTTTPGSKSKNKTKDKVEELRPETGTEAGTQLYVAEMKGNFGVDVSETTLRRLFEDVDRVFNDIMEESGPDGMRTVVKPEFRESHVVVLRMDAGTNPRQGFDGLFRVEDLAPIIEEQIVGRHRRVVFWVERAENGAALFPWVSREMYFTNDGIMGFTGDLQDFSIGDEMVDEKQISLRIGHAEGFAVKGGYDPTLIKPMVRSKYWLAVRFEGGEPVYLTRKPKPEDGEGWVILTDDGEGENEDKKARGANDLLVLDQEWAQKLKVSRGTVDTLDDLAFQLGTEKNYKKVESKADDIMSGWRKEVEDFLKQVSRNPNSPGRLWRDFNEIRVEGDYDQRTKGRMRQLQILKQIRSLFVRYKEFADPDGSAVADIDVQINFLEQEQARDKKVTKGI